MKSHHLILVLVISTLLLTACKGDKNTSPTPETVIVTTQAVESVIAAKSISVSGNIEGNKTLRLGFMVAGKINFIAVEEGQNIRSGQLLASLDPESYQIAKDMADANLEQTQDEYDRLNQMYERKSISESDYAKVKTALKIAKSQQQLQTKNLRETKLYAPISGVLLKKLTEKGEIIGTGMPLFVISDISSVKVNASVPASELRDIKIGSQASIYISALDTTYKGKVTEIGAAAEATTRSFTIKIDMKNPRLLLRPGMLAEIDIATNNRVTYLVVPTEAILHELDNSSYVYIADTIKQTAIKRKVALGGIAGNQIKIASGLNEGEQVIITGQHKLSSGTAINIK